MDKKKSMKDRRKPKKSSKSRKERESMNFFRDMQEQGLEQIFLSPLTQKVLECRIGEEISPERRWVFIKKEKIEDNLFLHDTSSEFLPLKNKIEKYPEPMMLIGSFSHIQDAVTDFFLCTNVNVKEEIISVIEAEKRTIFERMWNIMHPTPGPWKDLGSQEEVDDSMIKKNRSLLEIILGTEYPIPYHFTKFKMCLAGDVPFSYANSGVQRFAYELILRKRVDVSTQCKYPTEEKGLQSVLAVSRNKQTQYSYHCDLLEMNEETLDLVVKFFQKNCEILHEKLLVNFNINLFLDDYKELAINDKGIVFKDPIELRSYQDVINCKHKKVSCISWNALVSGMVAVAYNITPLHYVGKHHPVHNDAEDTVYEKHLILIWMYNDNVRPILYIHAYREVTSLSFCPYDPNILVAGYSNGQIAVWDITDRIGAVESREVLTQLEQHHRALMAHQTTWIKPPYGIQHVFPTITSLFGTSHQSAVTSIKWIPSSHYISRNGRYEESQSEEHMQFFTVSLNGYAIQVWDLKIQKQQLEKNIWKKKIQRLSKLPEALTKTESPLKKLQKIFIPHYRLYVKDPVTGKRDPLTNIIAYNQLYRYDALNPSTLQNIEERTYFAEQGLKHPFVYGNKLMICTALGELSIVRWEGSAYNQGLSVNAEPCTLTRLARVHDGPITTCELNPFLPDILLTTGGSVFAIWKSEVLHVPILWRKSNVRYIAGMWSFRHPLTLFMTRSDSLFEIWNILEKSQDPVRVFKYKGSQIIALFNDPDRLHVRKETFITSDIVGGIKVFNLPSGVVNHNDVNIEDSIDFVNHVIAIKKYTEYLKKKHKMILEPKTEEVKEEEETKVVQIMEAPEPKIRKEKVTPPPKDNLIQRAINRWQNRSELHMYNILLEKKRLNIQEIENNRVPMQFLRSQEERKQQKISDKILVREEDFKKIKDTLLVPIESHKIRRKITVSLPKKITKILKQTYYENFKLVEKEAMHQIHCCNFDFTPNWNEMLQFGVAQST